MKTETIADPTAPESIPRETLDATRDIMALLKKREDVSDEVAAVRQLLAPDRALAVQRAAEWRALDEEFGAEPRALAAVDWEALGGLISSSAIFEMTSLIRSLQHRFSETPRQMDAVVARIDALTLYDIERQAVGLIRRDVAFQQPEPRPLVLERLQSARRLLGQIREWLAQSPNAASKTVKLPAFVPDEYSYSVAPKPSTLTDFDPLA